MRKRSDLAGPSPYTGETPETKNTLRRDYTEKVPTPHIGPEEHYRWVTDGKHILVGTKSEKSHDLWRRMTGLQDFKGPYAQGALTIEYGWNAEWTVFRSTMSLHLLMPIVKKYTKTMGWKFKAMLDDSGMPYENFKLGMALDPPEGYEGYYRRIQEHEQPQRYYHVAPRSAREDILVNGLNAKGRTHNTGFSDSANWDPETGAYYAEDAKGDLVGHEWRPEAVYMWGDPDEALYYRGSSDDDIWEIDPQHLDEVIADPSTALDWEYGGEWANTYATEYVPPEALRLRDDMAGKDWRQPLGKTASIIEQAAPEDDIYDSLGNTMQLQDAQMMVHNVQAVNAWDGNQLAGTLLYREPHDEYLWIDNVYTVPEGGRDALFSLLGWVRDNYPGYRIESYFMNPQLEALAERYNDSIGEKAQGKDLPEWQQMDQMMQVNPQVSQMYQEQMQKRGMALIPFYHAAPSSARDSILQHGIDGSKLITVKSDLEGYHSWDGQTYAFTDQQAAEDYAQHWANQSPVESFDIWRIDDPNDERDWETDYDLYPGAGAENEDAGAMVTPGVIPPEHLTLVETVRPYGRYGAYPGIGEINPGLKDWKNREWSDTEQYDQNSQVDFYGEQDPVDDEPAPGPRMCSECGHGFPNYRTWRIHVERAHINPERKPLPGPLPVVDLDQTMPADWNTNIMDKTVMRQSAADAGARVWLPDGQLGRVFRLYTTLPGKQMAVVLPLGKESDGYAEQHIPVDELQYESAQGLGSAFGDEITSLQELQPGDLLYDNSITYQGEPNVVRVLRLEDEPSPGFYGQFVNPADPMQLRSPSDQEFFTWYYQIPTEGFRRYNYNPLPFDNDWRTAAQSQIALPGPTPFIFDIEKDRIYVGHPGERHSDIQGRFTPGGIVEGIYKPDGNVEIRTDTDMPYTVSHMLQLWSYMHPELVPKSVYLVVGQKQFRLASANIGHKVRNIAFTEQAIRDLYQGLMPYANMYIVGGAVRDTVMGKLPKDIDVLVQGMDENQLLQIASSLPGQIQHDGTTLRYRAQDGSTVELRATDQELDQDLAGRDFTANAMAVNLATGELYDPYLGVQDVREQKLRAINDDVFQKSPSRLLRGLSLISRHGLEPDEDTYKLMKEQAHHVREMKGDAASKELDKLFRGDDPARAIEAAMQTGLLHHILPEVAATQGFDQRNKHHRHELDEHLMDVLHRVAELNPDPDVRMAALLHDIGKPASQFIDEQGTAHYYHDEEEDRGANHADVGAAMAHDRLTDLGYPTDRVQRVQHLVQHHMFPPFSGPNGAKKFLKNVGSEHAYDLLHIRQGDQVGKGSDEWESQVPVQLQRQLVENVLHHKEPFSRKDLAVNGHDLMTLGIPEGPSIGSILDMLAEQVLENPSLNERGTLLDLAKQYATYQSPTHSPQTLDKEGQPLVEPEGQEKQASSSMRMFISFDLPEGLDVPIRLWQEQVMQQYPNLRPDTEGLHITIAFLGDISMEQAQAIQQVISEMALPLPTFTVAGYEEQERLSWLRLQDDGSGEAWFNALWEQLSPITGYQPQYVPWTPHLTMFRYDQAPGIMIPPPDLGGFAATGVVLYQSSRETGYTRFGNVLDPIHESLDSDVWDNPGAALPKLKPKIRRWILSHIYRVIRENGWPDPKNYLSVDLTGSLTTYQWAHHSDCDLSLFVDADSFPDWVRGDLIGIMVDNLDGTIIPGTTHPIQCFVVAKTITKDKLYKRGLRSAYDVDHEQWLIAPEHERSVDVNKQFPAIIRYCQMVEDKMRLLLRFSPHGAKMMWHRIHHARMRDQSAGKGDYAESNIIYKWLFNAGLFPTISAVTGEHLATVIDWENDERQATVEEGRHGQDSGEAPQGLRAAARLRRRAEDRQAPCAEEPEGWVQALGHAEGDEGPQGSLRQASEEEYVWPELEHVLGAAQDPNVVENYQGIRDEGLLHSALGATMNQHYYGGTTDPFELAAHMINNIQRQQAIVEGNKRTATAVGVGFLQENGYPEAGQMLEESWSAFVEYIVGMAEGSVTPEQLAEFMRHAVTGQ